MTGGSARERPHVWFDRARPWLAGGGVVVAVLALVPPLGGLATRYQVIETLQFAMLAIAVPALIVLGAPWSTRALARPAERLAAGRRRHPELLRCACFVAVDLAVIVAWRTPSSGGRVASSRWLVPLEAVSLIVAGIGLWLECVDSPPIAPRMAPPRRAMVAAVAMWAVWITAYLGGFSHTSWYGAFHHVAGQGLSAPADQQLSTAVLWFVAAAAFAPVVFVDVLRWLRTEDDPDDEMHHLVRVERRHGWASPPPVSGRRGEPAS